MSQTKVQLVDLNGLEAIIDADADTSITADTDDQIDFRAGGTDVMSMTATGLTINDGVEITTADNTDTLTLTSTDADASSGPNLRMYRNSSSPADSDTLGVLEYEGRNDNSEDIRYVQITSFADDVSDGTEDGSYFISTSVAGTLRNRINVRPTETVFNEESRNIDFRVESEGETHLLFVDAGNDALLVNTSGQSGGEKVSIRSTSNQKMLVLDNANDSLADQVLQLSCKRPGTSSYNFARFISDSHSGQDDEFIVTGVGNVFADGTYTADGADYAEFFETNDGNGIDVGKTVVLDGDKVRASTSSDDASTILGVVRPKVDGINSMMIGNTAWNRWTNKYLHDDYGRFIMEDYSVTEWVVKTYEDGRQQTESYETDKIPSDVTVPDNAVVKTQQRKKLNSDFDKDKEYKPRSERDEWVIIGMLGQIQVTKGQKTGDRWIKMRDISDTVEEWLVR